MKKALVIGASSDIGLEVTRGLIKKNYYIYCTYFKNLNKIKTLHKNNLNKIEYIQLDLQNYKNVKNFVKKIKTKTRNIDVIILGANNNSKRKKFNLLNFKSFHNKIISNFLSNVFLIQLLIKGFLKKKIKIIHISSLVSKKGSWGLSEYSSSKAALDNVLKCLQHEYKNLDISSVYLSAVKTKGYFFTNKYNRSTKTKFISPKKAGLWILKKI